MSAISWVDVAAYSSPLAAADPIVQSDILALVNSGFKALPGLFDGEDGQKTRLARIYIACHFASLPGAGEQRPAGPVVSQTRGGLTQSYQALATSGNSTWNDTQWGRRYLQLLLGSRATWPRVPGMIVP